MKIQVFPIVILSFVLIFSQYCLTTDEIFGTTSDNWELHGNARRVDSEIVLIEKTDNSFGSATHQMKLGSDFLFLIELDVDAYNTNNNGFGAVVWLTDKRVEGGDITTAFEWNGAAIRLNTAKEGEVSLHINNGKNIILSENYPVIPENPSELSVCSQPLREQASIMLNYLNEQITVFVSESNNTFKPCIAFSYKLPGDVYLSISADNNIFSNDKITIKNVERIRGGDDKKNVLARPEGDLFSIHTIRRSKNVNKKINALKTKVFLHFNEFSTQLSRYVNSTKERIPQLIRNLQLLEAATGHILETNKDSSAALQSTFTKTIPTFNQQMKNIQAKRDASLQSVTNLAASAAQNLENAVKKLSVVKIGADIEINNVEIPLVLIALVITIPILLCCGIYMLCLKKSQPKYSLS